MGQCRKDGRIATEGREVCGCGWHFTRRRRCRCGSLGRAVIARVQIRAGGVAFSHRNLQSREEWGNRGKCVFRPKFNRGLSQTLAITAQSIVSSTSASVEHRRSICPRSRIKGGDMAIVSPVTRTRMPFSNARLQASMPLSPGRPSRAHRPPPAQSWSSWQEFCGRTTQVVFRSKGTVSEFHGDAILAIFGAPRRLSDHAERAVA